MTLKSFWHKKINLAQQTNFDFLYRFNQTRSCWLMKRVLTWCEKVFKHNRYWLIYQKTLFCRIESFFYIDRWINFLFIYQELFVWMNYDIFWIDDLSVVFSSKKHFEILTPINVYEVCWFLNFLAISLFFSILISEESLTFF